MTQPRPRRFQPRLWPTLATLAGLAILVSLATWQTLRFLEKEAAEEQVAAHEGDPPVEVRSLADFDAMPMAYRPVRVHGHLDPTYIFLFKHRIHDGKPGYWLGGVLLLADSSGALLVNRGWLPREQAHLLAARPPDATPTTYTGLIYQPTQVIADTDTRSRLGATPDPLRLTPTDAPIEWETYDLSGIAQLLPFTTPGTPTVLVLGPEHSGRPYPLASLDYVTKPYLTAERHLEYATFWWSVAAALLAMYLASAFGVLRSAPHRPAPSDAS